MKMFYKTLMAVSVITATSVSFAYDQPWNGYREDITSATSDQPADDVVQDATPKPSDGCQTNSPVYSANGFFYWSDSDIKLPVRSGLKVKRTYNSQDFRVGLFGRGWITAQEEGIARTWKAITEGNDDGSPKDAENYTSVPIWLAQSGRRYILEETDTGCNTPEVLSFTITKLPDGRWKAAYDNSNRYDIFSSQGYVLQRYDDRLGLSVYYAYDEKGQLVREYDSDGNALSFSFNDKGLVSTVEDQAGRQWLYEYDELGRLTDVTSPEGVWRRYEYQEADFVGYKQHLLTAIYDDLTDPLLTVQYSKKTFYNEYAMRVTQYTDRITGKRHEYSYTPTYVSGLKGMRTQKRTYQLDGGVQIADNVYDSTLHNLSVVRSFNNNTNTGVARKFNEKNRLTTYTNERGITTEYAYDEFGYLTKSTTLSRSIATEFVPNTNRIAKRNYFGEREVSYTYDDSFRVLSKTEKDLESGQGRTWKYSYNPNTQDAEGNPQLGQLVSVDGPQEGSADTVNLTYDDRGRVTNIALPEGLNSSFSYNPLGLITELQQVNGSVAKFTYDGLNRPTTVDLNGNITSYSYNSRGLVISMSDALNRTTRIDYDGEDRITKITYADGSYSTLSYLDNSTSRKVSEELYSASGSLVIRSSYSQDARTGHLISTANSDKQTLATYTYNNLQDLTTFTEEGNGVYQYNYTSEGLVSSVSNPLGQVTSYVYDALNRLTQVTAPNGAETSYSYNGFGELVREESADRGTTEYQYDNAGNLSQLTRANGTPERYDYDALSRLKSIDYDGTEYDAVLSYDQTVQGRGALGRTSNSYSTLSFDYDLDGRTTGLTQTVDGVSYNQSYTYNAAGERTSQTYPSGISLLTRYDETGRIESLNLEASTSTTSILNNLVWQGPLLKGSIYGNGVTESQSYNTNGRLIERAQEGVAAISLLYTLQSNIASTEYSLNEEVNILSFTYDALNRLTQETIAGQADTYSYDANGNRLTKNSDSLLYTDNSNRLFDFDGQTIVLDPAGNTLDDGDRSFAYNVMNRMASVSHGGNTTRYRYNTSGQRVSKTLQSGEQIHFVYGLAGELLGEYTATGQRIREYLYLQGEGVPQLVAQIEADGTIIYLHTDHLGTPRYATNSSKKLVWSWVSDGFGSSLPNEDTDGDGNMTVVNIRFAGQYFDSESGLHYNYYRDYDPRTGRYIQSDPIGLDGGLNTYLYALASPLLRIDPYGLIDNIPNPNGVVPGGPWQEAKGQRPGTYYGPAQSNGPRATCRYVPDGANGGPAGAREPYWKVKTPGQAGWQRFNLRGNPITPEQAHPSLRGGPRGGVVRGIGAMVIISEVIRSIADYREAQRNEQCPMVEDDIPSCI